MSICFTIIKAFRQVDNIVNGCRKRTLHLYAVTATNLVLPRANAETSHSVQIGPSSSYERSRQW
jgi:hypothetical protein